MNYQDEMHIDENMLDMEILDQPELMVKYSTLLAEAKQERDLAKEALDLLKAEIDRDIRNDPDKYELPKITEPVVSGAILMQDEYQEALKILHDANFEVNVLQGVVYAVDARKSALENLVKLHGQEYFAGPAVPHDLSELRKEKQENLHHRVGKAMRRKKQS